MLTLCDSTSRSAPENPGIPKEVRLRLELRLLPCPIAASWPRMVFTKQSEGIRDLTGACSGRTGAGMSAKLCIRVSTQVTAPESLPSILADASAEPETRHYADGKPPYSDPSRAQKLLNSPTVTGPAVLNPSRTMKPALEP